MAKSEKIPLSGKSTASGRKPRRLKAPSYASFRLQRHIKPVRSSLPSGYQFFKRAVRILAGHWKLFAGIILIYGLLNALLVQSFSAAGNVTATKDLLDQVFGNGFKEVVTSASIFVYLLGSSGNSGSETAGAYQMILALVVSLALIWTLREVYAGSRVRIRDGFYRGMYPLVPFLLVLCVILLQLVPMLAGLFLYNIATAQGVAVTAIEHWLWFVFLCMTSLLSFYWMSSSVFAMYIVCLPEMTPLKALRSARELVKFRRWTIIRKIAFLPFCMLVAAGLIMIPIIWVATPLTPWVFFVLSMAIMPLIHTYMYTLYRELL